MTIELIATLHVLANVIFSCFTQRRFMGKLARLLIPSTIVFAIAWLAIAGAWLEWWLFIELGAVIGTAILFMNHRALASQERSHSALWGNFAFMNAKRVRPEAQELPRPPRKPCYFDPNEVS